MLKKLIFVFLLLVLLAGGLFVGIKLYRRRKLANSYVNQNTSVNNSTASPTENSGNLTLTIDSPSEGLSVNGSKIIVSGTTIPDAEVSVNEVDTTADSSGKFSATVNLDEGENSIAVVANDANGNFVEKDVTVTYNPGQ